MTRLFASMAWRIVIKLPLIFAFATFGEGISIKIKILILEWAEYIYALYIELPVWDG